MINFQEKPYFLCQDQIKDIYRIFNNMTLEEKIGQIFCPIGNPDEDKQLRKFIQTYHPGAMMFRASESRKIKHIHQLLQQESNIPLLLAANLESGGNGICLDGTYFSRPMGIAATNDKKYAYYLGQIAGKEANAVGCNWSFAPIVDIDFNCLNPITNIRTYGSQIETIIHFACEQIKGLRESNVIPCIKHFPGDGVDMRDQHLLSSVNDLEVAQWDQSYGKIYKKLIDDGVETLMVGHIHLPYYVRYFNPDIEDKDILPASLSREILIDLLRNKLRYNGLVVTDATPMIGYNASLPRSLALPLSIENGCDMILFNKNIDEDYQFIRDGIKKGILSHQRLDEAVLRILATKMKEHLFDNNVIKNDISIVGCKEHQSLSYQCASKAITLVKNKENLLPICPQKYKRIRLYSLKDKDEGGFKESECHKSIKYLLEEKGFEVTEFNNQDLNFYEIFESGVEYIKNKCDLVIYLAQFDTASNYTVRRIEWIKLMAADAPWFVNEVPTIFISMANPYHLLDVPMAKTYINCYSNNDATLEALVHKLVGEEAFEGISPVDAFCGRWDTRR